MRILLISQQGDGCGIAHHLARDGHAVDMWIRLPEFRNALRGIVNRVDSFRPHIASADLILCDMVGFSQYLDLFQRLGKPVLCCDPVMDILELDRGRSLDMMRRLGMKVPTTHSFQHRGEAAELPWTCEHGMVVKPSGNLPAGQTYICPTQELYLWALQQLPSDIPLLVQTYIPPSEGVEVSTEGWWNGVEWMHPFNHTFEDKRLCAGGIGKMTGCQGNVVLPLKSPNRLVEETVMRLTPVLRHTSYRGPVDVNAIVTKDEAAVLELTCRFGYDAIEAQIHGMQDGALASFLLDTARGMVKDIPIRGWDYLLAVRCTLPPYPNEGEHPYKAMPLSGIDNGSGYVFFSDIQRLSDGMYVPANSDGVLLKVASNGRDVREAQRRAYSRIGEIKAIDLQYRNDIGRRVDSAVNQLRNWGWL